MTRYPQSGSSLRAWAQHMEQSEPKHFTQLRQTFAAADYIRPYTVFNVSGNKYRLIAHVNYGLQVVSIENVLTHADYDRGKWRRLNDR